jgi:hypothetical protein
VLSVLGRQGLRCLRSSCRAGRAAANERVASVTVKKLAPLPPNLPNLRRVDYTPLYKWDMDGGKALSLNLALAAAVAALPDSVVGIEVHAAGRGRSPELLAAIGARRGLQSLGFECMRKVRAGVLDALVLGPFPTGLTSLKLQHDGWHPPASLLQQVPWQQLQVGRAPLARMPGLREQAKRGLSRASPATAKAAGTGVP